ncbi:hypothetical protein WK67_01215 [Burkholderia ubonensis]|uniref:Uncharacterized protein n=1 Tax=Burkholderia ubonensis TaxID=101571 RepID=A0AAU8U888_9BURK|nr:hypothetical protein [Burkholderia ubonensis]AOK21422.1 hypothetical protein WK67_01215 [Burkholderia ubonensis]
MLIVICATVLRRPTARFAGLLFLSTLRQFRNHILNVGLRDFALLLLAWLRFVSVGLGAPSGTGR